MEQIAKGLLSWASILEDQAREQALRTASLPWIRPHVALMPDAHWGMGSTVARSSDHRRRRAFAAANRAEMVDRVVACLAGTARTSALRKSLPATTITPSRRNISGRRYG